MWKRASRNAPSSGGTGRRQAPRAWRLLEGGGGELCGQAKSKIMRYYTIIGDYAISCDGL